MPTSCSCRTASLPPSFPLYGFERKYSEGWLDEFRYLDLKDRLPHNPATSTPRAHGQRTLLFRREHPLQFPYKPLCSVLETAPLAERYFLSAADIDHWRYLKGAKQETRHRRNGSTYFFSEGSMAFPDRSDFPARTMLTSEGSVSPQHPCSRRPTDPTAAYANAHRMRTAQRLPR